MTKEETYKIIYQTVSLLVDGEQDSIANMANTVAVIKENFDFLWVGFYIVRGDRLKLGPFQGPVACTEIRRGKGVCGTAWERAESIVVPDVHKFDGHIACSSKSKSEIVIPVFKDREVVGVLDVDSEYLNAFDETDEKYLTETVKLINF
ncbi:MAG: GAF domain-containing protein [Prevotellaceae bacterium]|jgi:GAF domain-containing protein|nr:GAF domain-containing protein [Prevotellaceae bacterium]